MRYPYKYSFISISENAFYYIRETILNIKEQNSIISGNDRFVTKYKPYVIASIQRAINV